MMLQNAFLTSPQTSQILMRSTTPNESKSIPIHPLSEENKKDVISPQAIPNSLPVSKNMKPLLPQTSASSLGSRKQTASALNLSNQNIEPETTKKRSRLKVCVYAVLFGIMLKNMENNSAIDLGIKSVIKFLKTSETFYNAMASIVSATKAGVDYVTVLDPAPFPMFLKRKNDNIKKLEESLLSICSAPLEIKEDTIPMRFIRKFRKEMGVYMFLETVLIKGLISHVLEHPFPTGLVNRQSEALQRNLDAISWLIERIFRSTCARKGILFDATIDSRDEEKLEKIWESKGIQVIARTKGDEMFIWAKEILMKRKASAVSV
ncbi:hypothetical protein HK098_003594 [Nowakowskiella sp. JEL0407]|nr:hypothetical protein HK098_003594 [Nowakowskiella sp. JEL0407]